MKLSNPFKKETTKKGTSKIEKLEKTQLNKVIGGTDELAVVQDGKKGLNAVNVKLA